MGKIYNFFSGSNNRSGQGISKKQVEFDKKLGFKFFFKLMKMRLGKFSGSNLIFALCNIVIFIALYALTGAFDDSTTTAANPLYATVNAIAKNDSSASVATLYSIYCGTTTMRVLSTVSNIMLKSIYALVITFGLSSIGMIYNMRNICTGEHVDTWHDFFYAIKRNIKQGSIIAIIDGLVLYLLIYDLMVYSASQDNSFMHLVFYYAIILITVIYYIMRFYIYLQLVSCEMKISKMFKNAFLLTSLGIKRNLVAILATVVTVFVFIYMFFILPQAAIIAFCMIMFSLLYYIGTYCAYPVFKKYVVDPYYAEHPDELPEDPWTTSERVFVDRE